MPARKILVRYRVLFINQVISNNEALKTCTASSKIVALFESSVTMPKANHILHEEAIGITWTNTNLSKTICHIKRGWERSQEFASSSHRSRLLVKRNIKHFFAQYLML